MQQVNEEWLFWRLVMSEKFTYTEVFDMNPHEVRRAHVALERYDKEQKKASKNK